MGKEGVIYNEHTQWKESVKKWAIRGGIVAGIIGLIKILASV